MRKEIDLVKNSHKWTRYAALSVVLAAAPLTGVLASAASSTTLGAVVVAAGAPAAASFAPFASSPDSNKWT